MAKSITVEIADQIVTDLTAAVAAVQLAPSFTVERKFLPRKDLKTLAAEGNRVLVTPADRQGQRATRAQRQYLHSIDVGLIAKISTEEGAQQEDLDKLAEDIGDWFFSRPLGAGRSEQLETVTTKFLFEPDELLNNKIFLSVLTLNWRAFRT